MKKIFCFAVLLACFMGVSQAQVTVAPITNPRVQFFNNSVPCAGCLLDTFAAGTTTPLATYSESTGTTPNANPVVLGSDGSAVVYLTSASYKFRLRTAAGATLWTQDVVSWATPLSTFSGITSTGNVIVQPATAATGGANQSSPTLCIQGFYFNVTSLTDQYCLQDILGTGTNPASTFTLTHSGSSGAATFSIPGNVSVGGTLGVTGAGPGGVGTAAGGTINVQKPTSSGAIFMGRMVDTHGDTNAQLLGFNIEQMLNPTGSVNYQNSAYTGELFIPIGNTQNFTGNQIAGDFAFVNYGSGTFSGNVGTGVVGEAWNSGPATSILELDGVSGGCHNGSITAGIPSQTPTGNGNVTNCRGVTASVSNPSSGTITDAPSIFANACTNTGGGSIGTCYGIKTADQTAGGTNYAGFFGAGRFHAAGAADFGSTLTVTGGSGTGSAAFGTTGLLTGTVVVVAGSASTTGTTQFGLRAFPSLGGTTTSVGISGRADVLGSAVIGTSISLQADTPSVGAGTINNWHGLDISKAPVVGSTACSMFLAGSTSGATCINPSAVASGTITYPAATGTVDLLEVAQTFTATKTLNNAPVAGGTAAALTGTGACATITTQTGGSWAGRATCTGTTGASTLTITPGTTAPNGWVCNVQDQTTRANLFQQTATVAASCTLTVTSVTQNDVFVFSAIAF